MSWQDFAQQSQASMFADASPLTLWMGDLEPWMTEDFVKNLWNQQLGEAVNVKMIRDKFTQNNAGYCFVEFQSPQACQAALALNGQSIQDTRRVFKLNWASGGGLNDRRTDRGPEYSIFVGDLGPEVTDFMLLSLFQQNYSSCKSAKVVTDPMTNVSRGYGFVRFTEELDMQRALSEMQGQFCGSRPMRISLATPKTRDRIQNGLGGPPQGLPSGMGGMSMNMGYAPLPQYNQFTDPTNTTVFVGGLSAFVSEEELRSYFAPFGMITYVKIPPGKGCGFVQYAERPAAQAAIDNMNGANIGGSRIRLSWGRSHTATRPAFPPATMQAQQIPAYQVYAMPSYPPQMYAGGMVGPGPANPIMMVPATQILMQPTLAAMPPQQQQQHQQLQQQQQPSTPQQPPADLMQAAQAAQMGSRTPESVQNGDHRNGDGQDQWRSPKQLQQHGGDN